MSLVKFRKCQILSCKWYAGTLGIELTWCPNTTDLGRVAIEPSPIGNTREFGIPVSAKAGTQRL